MKSMTRAFAALVLTAILSGCCMFGPPQEAKSLGEMSEVLRAVRKGIADSRPAMTPADPALGMQISKLTATFKVSATKVAGSDLKLSIVEPVGSIGGSASATSVRENTIVVEFSWPTETVEEVCPAKSTDSLGRGCKPGDKVPVPRNPWGVFSVPLK